MGGIYGCGCKDGGSYYLSLLLLYLFFFAAASLVFVHFLNKVIHGEESLCKSRYCCN